MKKNRWTVFLSVIFILASSFLSLADYVASASDAVYVHPEPLSWSQAVALVEESKTKATATPADAEIMTLDLSDDDFGVSLFSSIGTVVNTFDYSDASITLVGTHKDTGTTAYFKRTFDNNGKFTFADFTEWANYDFNRFYVRLYELPPAGNYYVSLDMSSDISFDYSRDYGWMVSKRTFPNATTPESNYKFTFSSNSGDFYLAPFLVNIGSLTSLDFVFYSDDITDAFSGSVRIRFDTYLGSDSQDAVGTAVGDYSEADYQQGVSSSLGSIGDTLQEIVATISLQLEALWNQMYNYIHLPEYNKLEEIRQAIANIDLELDLDFDSITNKIDEQISNDNANTDKITNGYDNSSINSENEKLSGKLEELESAENDVVGSASDKLDDFEFDDSFFADYIKPLEDVGYMLSGIYVALGGLNIPIGFTLTLTIALLLIGYYRFKGGS